MRHKHFFWDNHRQGRSNGGAESHHRSTAESLLLFSRSSHLPPYLDQLRYIITHNAVTVGEAMG